MRTRARRSAQPVRAPGSYRSTEGRAMPRRRVPPASEQAVTLLRKNMPPSMIADLLGMPAGDVARISRSIGIIRRYPSQEDEEIATAMRRLSVMAAEVATDILMFGNYRERASMARVIVARTMGVIGSESPLGLEEMRAEWEELIGAQGAPALDIEVDDEGEAEEPSA